MIDAPSGSDAPQCDAPNRARRARAVLVTALAGVVVTALGCAVLSGSTEDAAPWCVWALYGGEEVRPDGKRGGSKWDRVAETPGGPEAFEITTTGYSYLGARRTHQSIGFGDERLIPPVGWLFRTRQTSYLDVEEAAVDLDGERWIPFTLSLERLAAPQPTLHIAGDWEFVEDVPTGEETSAPETTRIRLDVDGTTRGHAEGALWAQRGDVLAVDWTSTDHRGTRWNVRMFLLAADEQTCVGRGPHLAPMRGRRTGP